MRALVGSGRFHRFRPRRQIRDVGEAARGERKRLQILAADYSLSTTLTRSIGCVVMDEFWPCTETVSGGAASFSVTVTSRTELTAMDTFAWAGANPAALTAMRYAPGSRSSSRNSPRSSLWPRAVSTNRPTAPRFWRKECVRRSHPAPRRAESLADSGRAERSPKSPLTP